MMFRILLLFALLIAPGCCSHPVALKAIDRAIGTNKGHMDDASVPQHSREIAMDNYDVFNQVKSNIYGTAVPAHTAARAAARKKAKEEAEAAAAAAGSDG